MWTPDPMKTEFPALKFKPPVKPQFEELGKLLTDLFPLD